MSHKDVFEIQDEIPKFSVSVSDGEGQSPPRPGTHCVPRASMDTVLAKL